MKIIELSPETQEYMSTITQQMKNIGVLEEADKQNLDLLGSQVELYVRSMKELDENGLTAIDTRGRSIVNPAFNVARSSITNITSLMKELSITTRQRRLLTRDEIVDEEDPMDIFLEQMKNELNG